MSHLCFVIVLTMFSLAGTLRSLHSSTPSERSMDPVVGPALPSIDRLEVTFPPPARNVHAEPPNYLLHITPVYPEQE